MKPQLTYGIQNEKLVHISEVGSGIACNCICPSCKSILVAKKGEEKGHHFAHNNSKECKKGIETALHLAAKDILIKHNRIIIPEVLVDFGNYLKPWVISSIKEIEFDEVRLESRLNDIVPDVLIMKNGVPLLIEVTVTHRVNKDKVEKIKEQNISAIEISLIDCDRNFAWQALESLIVNDVSNKKWIYNKRAELVKNKALNLSERKDLAQRGATSHVDNCPKEIRKWRGKSYANVMNDCIYCEYCLGFEQNYDMRTGLEHDFIYCGGKSDISSFKDFCKIVNSK
ncbi:competence protein CoiA family protein [Brevibacillus laterosporus]|uniref:competence protein CoiA family protein n=1 Tax=Brevibacillus laterosporus TaxID=1465 RepID=UPI002E1F79C5|nr:competence protein CoiA family protein [Brevibacillus laterosporus]MED1667199.1 competence protein CoiA family protein [Brevibacillus laterosporus]MED1719733.1 competence protein CoiA family protein [Brevibacillus laterosporus]